MLGVMLWFKGVETLFQQRSTCLSVRYGRRQNRSAEEQRITLQDKRRKGHRASSIRGAAFPFSSVSPGCVLIPQSHKDNAWISRDLLCDVGRGRCSKIIIRVFADTGSRCGFPDVLVTGHAQQMARLPVPEMKSPICLISASVSFVRSIYWSCCSAGSWSHAFLLSSDR